jgi:hypothetical protein
VQLRQILTAWLDIKEQLASQASYPNPTIIGGTQASEFLACPSTGSHFIAHQMCELGGAEGREGVGTPLPELMQDEMPVVCFGRWCRHMPLAVPTPLRSIRLHLAGAPLPL